MALVRTALLAVLTLSASASPLSKVARRLNSSGPPPACVEACPCIPEMMAAMPHDDPSGDDHSGDDRSGHDHGDEADMDGMGGIDNATRQAMEQMEQMCKYTGVIACALDNREVCDFDDGFEEFAGQMACVCDLCPHYFSTMMDFMTVMVSLMAGAFGGEEPVGGQLGDAEELMCRYTASMECLHANPEQCAGILEDQSSPSRKLSGMDMIMGGMMSNLTCDTSASTTEAAIEQATCLSVTTSTPGAVVSPASGRSPSPLALALLALVAAAAK